jgi:hypothetical protein
VPGRAVAALSVHLKGVRPLLVVDLYTRVVYADLRQVLSRAHPRERACRRMAPQYKVVSR